MFLDLHEVHVFFFFLTLNSRWNWRPCFVRFRPHENADPGRPRVAAVIDTLIAFKNNDLGAWIRGGDIIIQNSGWDATGNKGWKSFKAFLELSDKIEMCVCVCACGLRGEVVWRNLTATLRNNRTLFWNKSSCLLELCLDSLEWDSEVAGSRSNFQDHYQNPVFYFTICKCVCVRLHTTINTVICSFKASLTTGWDYRLPGLYFFSINLLQLSRSETVLGFDFIPACFCFF